MRSMKTLGSLLDKYDFYEAKQKLRSIKWLDLPPAQALIVLIPAKGAMAAQQPYRGHWGFHSPTLSLILLPYLMFLTASASSSVASVSLPSTLACFISSSVIVLIGPKSTSQLDLRMTLINVEHHPPLNQCLAPHTGNIHPTRLIILMIPIQIGA